MNLRRHTTYDRFFNKPFRPGMVEMSKALEAGKLEEYLQTATEKGKQLMPNIMSE